MPASWREHYAPVAVSVLLHGVLVGVLLLVTLVPHPSLPMRVQPLPIDAVVVDAQVLHAAQRAQTDRIAEQAAQARAAADAKATAAAAQADADAKTAADAAASADASAAAAAKQAAADAAADATAAAAAAEQLRLKGAQKAAETQKAQQAQRRVDEEKAAVEAQRAVVAKQTADARQAAEAKQAAADAKQAVEAKQAAADAKQAADVKQAVELKKVADERAKHDRETELRRQIADEEHASAVASGPLRDRYITLLRDKIQGAWIKPPSARAGIDCVVEVTQVVGGEVTAARVTQCNGDAAVRQSIENAVYRASPLPDPPDPALFEKNFEFRFKPND